MSSYEEEAICKLLLKRYEGFGFLNPASALDADIARLVREGRTRIETLHELYSRDSPRGSSSDSKPTVSQQRALTQISDLKKKIDLITASFSKGEIGEETYLKGIRKIEEEINALQQEHKITKTEQRRTPAITAEKETYDTGWKAEEPIARRYQEMQEIRHKELTSVIVGAMGVLLILGGILLMSNTVTYTTYEIRGEDLYQVTHFDRPYFGPGLVLTICGIVIGIYAWRSTRRASARRSRLQ